MLDELFCSPVFAPPLAPPVASDDAENDDPPLLTDEFERNFERELELEPESPCEYREYCPNVCAPDVFEELALDSFEREFRESRESRLPLPVFLNAIN